MNELTHAKLTELLDYDPLTGQFIRKTGLSKGSNTRFAGKPTGIENPKSYKQIRVDGKLYFAHRLAWFYVYGAWPDGAIDHIDRNRHNNRIANLRIATGAINQRNCKIPRNNSSGIKGVSWSKANQKWTASIYIDGKRKNLGYFDSLEDAREARLRGEREFY